MNGLTRFPLSLSTSHSQENGLGRISGERRPHWARLHWFL